MRGTYWAGELQPGEVALFHFEGKSRVMCSAGGNREGAVATKFATVQNAQEYAKQYVKANPARGCRIYDSTGQRIGDITGEECPAERYTRAQAKRDLLIGIAGFVVIPLGFLFDKWVGWGLFLGMAVATKFVMLGIIKMSEGIAGLMETRREEGSRKPE